MNLNTIAPIIRKNLIPSSLVFLILVFLISGVVNLTTYLTFKKENPVSLPPDLEFDSVVFSPAAQMYTQSFTDVALNNLPGNVSVLDFTPNITDGTLLQVSKKLGFKNSPIKKDNVSLFNESSLKLSFDFSQGLLSFQKITDLPRKGMRLDENQIKETTLNALTVFGWAKDAVVITDLEYIVSGNHGGVTTADKADTVLVHFQTLVGGLRIVESNFLGLDINGNVVNFMIYPPENYKKSGDFARKSLAEFKRYLFNQQVKIVNVTGLDPVTAPTSLSDVIFSGVSLGLVRQNTQLKFQPVFVLTGSTALANQSYPVTAVMPAISGVKIKP